MTYEVYHFFKAVPTANFVSFTADVCVVGALSNGVPAVIRYGSY